MPVTFEETKGDLFSCDQNCCLAHCVSKDLSMSKGIATEFRDRFGNINKLRAQSTRKNESEKHFNSKA